VWIHIIMPCR